MDPIRQLATAIAAESSSDVYFYNGPIKRGSDFDVIRTIGQSKSRDHATLLLVTFGGDADAAYKIARYIQDKYETFTVLVPGVCKSAGTLIAVGAHRVAFAPYGEIGPIDIQTYKTDNLAERQSGLTITESLDHLSRSAIRLHGSVFSAIMKETNAVISFKTASEAASELVAGLYSPILSQIDPIEVGDKARSMRIASDYGRRLDARSKNLKDDALETLTKTYPAHEFVIDMQEARSLFQNVRALTDEEAALVELFDRRARFPNSENETVFSCLSQAIDAEESNDSPSDRPTSAEANREDTEGAAETASPSEQNPAGGAEEYGVT